jgi:tetratricopeptide (TPR) repeat protein
LYRHRGHRFLSQWRFEDAAADFTLASRLIPENWDVWYHLGLSYFLLGNYEKAAWAYKVCYDMDDDPYPRIAVTDWYYMTLRRLGRHEEAKSILEPIAASYPPEKIKDNGEYYRRLLVYKGVIPLEKAIPEDLSTLKDIEIVTLGFGISNYYYLEGNIEKSNKIIDMILETGNKSDCFFGFGYLAAMVDKKNRSR